MSDKYCKFEKYQRWVSYDSGITWSPLQEFRTGDLIEEYSEDCGYTPTPTPTVIYRWVDIPLADDFYCSGTTKYYKQKMQQSEDSGTTWTDVVPPQYRMGASAESKSYDCGYAERTTSGIGCDNANKVVFIYYQVSDDHGASWTTTSSTVDSVIEYDATECGYQTRWVSGSTYCSGTTKMITMYHQESRDYGQTWSTIGTSENVVEYDSEDCGYVPPTPPTPSGSGDYLTFRALEDNVIINFRANPSTDNSLDYSIDGGTSWNHFSNTRSPLLASGDTMMVRGECISVWVTEIGMGMFSSSGAFEVEGNIMSLLYGDNFSGQTSLSGYKWAFHKLFSGCTNLISAENLVLPATTITESCYGFMFDGCTSLTTAPSVLPATTLAYNCYEYMFYGCTSLTTAPELPATTLASNCYGNMFYGCTSLTTAPELPATTLANSCYINMFVGCTALTTPPALSATTLASSCYWGMFNGCTSLTTAPSVLPATKLANYCYYGMFQNCRSLTSAPELPATTLANSCYSNMFNGCTSLNSITCLATSGINSNNSTTNWVNNVASSGTFYKNPNASWPSGSSGIPFNWSVQDY